MNILQFYVRGENVTTKGHGIILEWGTFIRAYERPWRATYQVCCVTCVILIKSSHDAESTQVQTSTVPVDYS